MSRLTERDLSLIGQLVELLGTDPGDLDLHTSSVMSRLTEESDSVLGQMLELIQNLGTAPGDLDLHTSSDQLDQLDQLRQELMEVQASLNDAADVVRGVKRERAKETSPSPGTPANRSRGAGESLDPPVKRMRRITAEAKPLEEAVQAKGKEGGAAVGLGADVPRAGRRVMSRLTERDLSLIGQIVELLGADPGDLDLHTSSVMSRLTEERDSVLGQMLELIQNLGTAPGDLDLHTSSVQLDQLRQELMEVQASLNDAADVVRGVKRERAKETSPSPGTPANRSRGAGESLDPPVKRMRRITAEAKPLEEAVQAKVAPPVIQIMLSSHGDN
ncbi:hypothetical protein NHX12_034487 [Muraenolepis orangiensis]|uniref:Uncharacterized protein n=1 Tax=Muraenolepis orangiensis TaxID=630683 RepID=A0A9Q0D8E8_9TELE|nr:hypothetical protein NHX12_034487 [Muraenolepis orangiensis]